MSSHEVLRTAVQAALEAHASALPPGVVVEDVVVQTVGSRRTVRILVDRGAPGTGPVAAPTDPLSLDEIAEITRAVGDALDDADPLGPGPYTLEVSSPGVGRALTEPRHFRRNVGRLLAVRGASGEHLGRLIEATDDEGVLEIAGVRGRPSTRRTFPFAGHTAEVQLEFSRAPQTPLDRTEPDGSDPGPDHQE